MAYILKYSGQEADNALSKALTAVQENTEPNFNTITIGHGFSIKQGDYSDVCLFDDDGASVTLKGVRSPSNDDEAANKQYVDEVPKSYIITYGQNATEAFTLIDKYLTDQNKPILLLKITDENILIPASIGNSGSLVASYFYVTGNGYQLYTLDRSTKVWKTTFISTTSYSATFKVILDLTQSSYTVPEEDYAKLQSKDCIVYASFSSGECAQLLRDNSGGEGTQNLYFIGFSSSNFEKPVRVTINASRVATFVKLPSYGDIGLSKVKQIKNDSGVEIVETDPKQLLFIGLNMLASFPTSNSTLSWDLFIVGSLDLTLFLGSNTVEFSGMSETDSLSAGLYKVLAYHPGSIRDTTYIIYKIA